MRPYLTPGRFRTMALGIDLAGKTDADLASLLASATTEVNRYCAAPRNHDFRGGSVTDEEHTWDVGNSHRRPSGRLWPYHRPIAAVSALRIFVTRNQNIAFTNEQLFINKRLGYVEPVATPATTALFTSVPPWLLSEPVAYIDYTYGEEFVVTDEVLYPDQGVGRVYRAVNQFWTSDPVTVKVAGVALAEGDYELDREEGLIILDTLPILGSVVTASYTHALPWDIALATGIVCSDMLGYSNVNASGLTGLAGIRVEEIELRQASQTGFNVYQMHPAAQLLLGPYVFASWG